MICASAAPSYAQPVRLEQDLTPECVELASTDWQRPGAARRGSGGRFFRSRLLEAFTRSPPWLPYLLVGPVALWLLGGALVSSLSTLGLIALVAGGVLIWTLVEYLMHRFLFHLPASSRAGRLVSFLVHGHHHLHPDDGRRIAATPLQFASLALLVGGALRLTVGEPGWTALTAGFLVGYLGYEAIHWIAHHGRPRSRLLRAIRRHHLRHHHEEPNRRWGISSPLWDRVFRTG